MRERERTKKSRLRAYNEEKGLRPLAFKSTHSRSPGGRQLRRRGGGKKGVNGRGRTNRDGRKKDYSLEKFCL